MVQLRLDKNSAAATIPNRAPVTLDKNKDFKQFDSLLATPYKSLTCLGCMKYTVTATLTGRIDGSKRPEQRERAQASSPPSMDSEI